MPVCPSVCGFDPLNGLTAPPRGFSPHLQEHLAATSRTPPPFFPLLLLLHFFFFPLFFLFPLITNTCGLCFHQLLPSPQSAALLLFPLSSALWHAGRFISPKRSLNFGLSGAGESSAQLGKCDFVVRADLFVVKGKGSQSECDEDVTCILTQHVCALSVTSACPLSGPTCSCPHLSQHSLLYLHVLTLPLHLFTVIFLSMYQFFGRILST